MIRKTGGEIVEPTAEQHKAFVSAVSPIYKEARSQFGRDLLALVGAGDGASRASGD